MNVFAQAVTPDIEWSLIWPFTILALAGVILITITSLVPSTRTGSFPAAFTAASGITAAFFIPFIVGRVNDEAAVSGRREFYVLADAIVVDNFTLFITGILCIAVVLTAFLLDDYTRREGLEGPEWYALILLSASGGILLASAEDLIVSFVGLEVLSIAVYVLAALHLRRSESQEAGFKYFVLGALSSAIFLYGIALVYGATGSTRLGGIAANMFVPAPNGLVAAENASLLLVGIAFILVGFGFKVSAAPFHVWTPDVYQGSPSPVVAFMASAVKVAAFGGFLRVFLYGFDGISNEWLPLVAALAILSLLIGSFFAVVQTNVKRMLAFSSISHAGFMRVGLHSAVQDEAGELFGGQAILFYLFTYSLTVIGSFAVVTVVGGRGDDRHHVDDYRGLAQRQPVLASLFAVLLFAQAGIPFTSGFMAKFRVIAAAAGDESYWLAGVAMLSAAVAAYLYLRIVVAMFMSGDDAHADEHDGAELAPSSVGAAASTLDADGDGSGGGDDGGDVLAAGVEPIVVPPAVLVVLVVSVAATILWGVLPDVGGDFLNDAAATLALLRP